MEMLFMMNLTMRMFTKTMNLMIRLFLKMIKNNDDHDEYKDENVDQNNDDKRYNEIDDGEFDDANDE